MKMTDYETQDGTILSVGSLAGESRGSLDFAILTEEDQRYPRPGTHISQGQRMRTLQQFATVDRSQVAAIIQQLAGWLRETAQ